LREKSNLWDFVVQAQHLFMHGAARASNFGAKKLTAQNICIVKILAGN
jgi:hypothetical protein